MALIICRAVREKLTSKHRVTVAEVEECFSNRLGGLLMDTRERHRTQPPTMWFIAATDRGRDLKVIFIQEGQTIYLKSAFEPNREEMRIYARHGLAS